MKDRSERVGDDGTQTPTRWATGQDGGASAEARVGQLLHEGDPAVGFDAAARARVLQRLRLSAYAARPRFRLPALRWAIAAAVLLTSGGGVIAAVTLGHWLPPIFNSDHGASGRQERGPSRAVPRRRARVGSAAVGAGDVSSPPATEDVAGSAGEAVVTGSPVEESAGSSSSPAEPAPVVAAAIPAIPAAPASPSVPEATPAPVPARRPQLALAAPRLPRAAHSSPPAVAAAAPTPAPTSAPPAAAASGLSVESALLSRAVVSLRQQHDGRETLAVLDGYDARFPHGTLAREAAAVRVDALLTLGRDSEALGVLRGLSLAAHGRDQELRIIRGELSAARDCAAAVADFDRLLGEASPDPLIERALRGRASCRARQGDAVGAAGDLDRYLLLFPHGRFTDEIRRARAAVGQQ